MIRLYFILFIIYSLVGWILEVLAKLKEKKKLVNRGFLIGPVCPIYGCGAVLMTILLGNFEKQPVLLFLTAIVLCSILEYFTSYLLERIFKARWWDYSNKKFNINGRICISTMIPFGILALLMTYVLNPYIYNLLNKLDGKYVNIGTIIVLILFLSDVVISITIFFKFKKTVILTGKDNTEEMTSLKRKRLKNDWLYQYRLLNLLPSALQMEHFIKENYSKTKEIINDKQLMLKIKTEFKIKSVKKRYDEKVANIKRKADLKIKKINKKKIRINKMK